jgi:hypothetical protein
MVLRISACLEAEEQDDQVGRIIAHWGLYTFGQFFENYIAQVSGLLFQRLRLCINLDKNGFGLNFGRLLHKLVWSPCRRSTIRIHNFFPGCETYLRVET